MDYRERWEHKDYLAGQTLDSRIRLFQIGLGILLLGFLLNFWYLQAVQGEQYADLAENNRLRRIPMPPTRGVVFDRNNAVLASTRPSLDLVLLRDAGIDWQEQLRRLVPILDTTYEELMERVERSRRRPAYEPCILREDVELEALAQIEARRELFPSVEVQQTARRSYPHGSGLAHVLGYVGEVSESQLALQTGELHLGDIVGRTGLERGYDDRLRGQRGWNLVSVNNLGRRMAGPWVGQEPTHGRGLRLTLDLRLQQALREALGDEVGAGVFMNPWTGEILALVSTPDFDPNLFADGMSPAAWNAILQDPKRPLHDRAIASFYAPGSIFKVVMAVAGLETSTINTEEVVHCGGSASFYGRRRLCWKRGGHGLVNLQRALAESCNVYFYNLGKKMGIDAIHEYGGRFNLGRLTGVDLPGEAEGILPSPTWKREHLGEYWYPGDTISVAIGQGYLAVTPIQIATMISAVATDGKAVRPYMVRGGRVETVQLDLKPWTLATIRRALREAVSQGTAKRADVPGVGVAGKTGTAQVYRHSAGIDSDELPKDERDHGWFAGYAPADDPRIAFAVVVEHGGHGGSSAAPAVRKVLEVFFSEELPGSPEPSADELAEGEGHVRAASAG